MKSSDPQYNIWFGDAKSIIQHCDKKIEIFFEKLDKKIEGHVKTEVEKWLKKNKPKVFKAGESRAKFQFNAIKKRRKK